MHHHHFQADFAAQRSHRRRKPSESQAERLLLHVVDASLVGCVVVLPFLMGGRQALGHFVLPALALVAMVAWLLRGAVASGFRWRWSGAEWLFVAGALLVGLQIAPLPDAWLQILSPKLAQILPLWGTQALPEARLGTWSTISLTPARTYDGLVILLAYAGLFVVGMQRFSRVEDIQWLLRWCAVAAAAMATFGLIQYFTSNGKFFWFYDYPYRDTTKYATGSFSCRNHFAHFLALGTGALVWFLGHTMEKRGSQASRNFGHRALDWQSSEIRLAAGAVALALVVFASMLSLSRAGSIMTLAAALIAAATCGRALAMKKQLLIGLVLAGGLLITCLSIFGHDRVGQRLETLSEISASDISPLGARLTIWETVLEAIPDFAIVGSGVGSHIEVYPMYLEYIDVLRDFEYTHAENGYLQVALETGLGGLFLMVVGIGFCGFWCVAGLWRARDRRLVICLGAIVAALAVNCLHSLVDFVWYVPGCMAMVALLAAAACRAWQLSADRSEDKSRPGTPSRPLLFGAAGVVLLVGGVMVFSRFGAVVAEPHWDEYHRLRLAEADALPGAEAAESTTEEESDAPAPDQRETPCSDSCPTRSMAGQPYDAPASSAGHLGGANEPSVNGEEPAVSRQENSLRLALASTTKMAESLEEVVAWNPSAARAHVQLAAAYLRKFDLIQLTSDNAFALTQIRDAAIRSQFPNREALDRWLEAAVGEHRQLLALALQHTRRGLQLCPLQGEGYRFLAELCFLECGQEAAAKAKHAYIEQALAVRPHDGDILFEAGNEAWLAGDFNRGLELWQRSFRSSRIQQEKLCRILAGRLPVDFFMQAFKPDAVALAWLHDQWSQFGPSNELMRLKAYYLAQVEKAASEAEGAQAAQYWFVANELHKDLGGFEQALHCMQQAVKANPNEFRAHFHLGVAHLNLHQYDEAEAQFRWCLARRPGHTMAEARLRRVLEERMQFENQTAGDNPPGDYRM